MENILLCHQVSIQQTLLAQVLQEHLVGTHIGVNHCLKDLETHIEYE